MTQVAQRPYSRRVIDVLMVPHGWLVLGTWLVGRVAVGLVLGGSLAALLRNVAVTAVPVFAVGVALLAALMDPYAEWVGRGRPWRSAAVIALGTVVVATAGAVFTRRLL